MKLINAFYHIIHEDQTDGLLRIQVQLHPEHFIYGVHFPKNPVTPGVCAVQIAQELLEEHYKCKLKLLTAVNIKFKQPIAPTALPTYNYSKMAWEDNQMSVQVSVEEGDTQYVKMSLKYGEINS